MLFVAPAVPSPTRSGLRMRGWLFLQGLARDHRVTLVAGSQAFPDESPKDTEVLSDLVERTVLLPFRALRDPGLLARRLAGLAGIGSGRLWDWAEPTPAMLRKLEALRDEPFDLIHVFRLYMLPVALAVRGAREEIPMQLDIDDWESRTRLAQAAFPGDAHGSRAAQLRRDAAAFERREREWLPRMSRCFVCSEADARALAACCDRSRITVVGNAVPVPSAPAPAADPGTADLLFVGSLGYVPNEDAVCFLLDEVLPLLRPSLGRPFRLVVAGAGAGSALRRRIRRDPDVTWVDAPARLEPLYQRAQVALVPVRAGGGTRVKALEAFAQGRPVIATAAAMAGLDVEPSVHYLRAESPAEWVEAVQSLLDSPALSRGLADAAFAWVRGHSLEKAIDQVASIVRQP